jgi:hypothetical protein
MPTTFKVLFLGNPGIEIDDVEGNTTSEKAGLLTGQVFGGSGGRLAGNIQEFSPGTAGFDSAGLDTVYNQNNDVPETFSIDGGPDQTYDGGAVYGVTITYMDGTTATGSYTVFQDTLGNTYLAPEESDNTDQTTLEAGPIASVEIGPVLLASSSGLIADRAVADFIPCYTEGTQIDTDKGRVAVEELSVGDMVCTRDNGLQAIRWIGQSTVIAKGKMAPVKIAQGALGPNCPERDLYVSRQHRMCVNSKIAQRMFDADEILVPAIKLVGLPGVEIVSDQTAVTYLHILTDQHEVIFAEGAPSETLLTGPVAKALMGPEVLAELQMLWPDMFGAEPAPARPIVENKRLKSFIKRHAKNQKALVS